MATSLSAPPRLGLQLGIGALLLVAAAWMFSAIAEDVLSSDRLTLVDADLAQWLHRHATAGATRWILLFTNLNSTIAMSFYSAVAGVVLLRRRNWWSLGTLALCMAGGLALNVAMKLAFHRARPAFEQPLVTLASYSFPSGHVAASTIFYGLGVAWVFSRTPNWQWRLLALVGAAVAIAAVAFSRLYLGAHYLSDVAAAFAEGVAWLALCLSALTAYRHHRAVSATPGQVR